MEDTTLDTLKQFIQEWTDIYNERQSNEVWKINLLRFS